MKRKVSGLASKTRYEKLRLSLSLSLRGNNSSKLGFWSGLFAQHCETGIYIYIYISRVPPTRPSSTVAVVKYRASLIKRKPLLPPPPNEASNEISPFLTAYTRRRSSASNRFGVEETMSFLSSSSPVKFEIVGEEYPTGRRMERGKKEEENGHKGEEERVQWSLREHCLSI